MNVTGQHPWPPPSWAEVLQEGLGRLSARQRLIVALRSCEGLGVAEIATALGLSPETTRRELGEALRALERALDESAREAPRAAAPGARGDAAGTPALPVEPACEGSGLP